MRHLPELRQLRYFVAVAEHKSFTRAAAALHLTQPPLTRQVKALEATIGAELLIREKSGLRLSIAGEYFLPEAKRILQRIDEIGETAAEIAGGRQGHIHIGFTSTVLYGALPGWVRTLRQCAPELKMSLHELTLREQLAAIREQTLDLGFALCIDSVPEFCTRRISREPLVACLPADHASAKPRADRPLKVSALTGESFISFPRDLAPRLHDCIVSYLASHSVPFEPVQEAVQMQTIIGLVSSGLGIALVPRSMQRLARSDVVYRQLSPQVPQVETQAVWSRSSINPALPIILGHIQGD
ncbi:MAG: LysR family transcriptional regulator [Pseudomonadota bacterium]